MMRLSGVIFLRGGTLDGLYCGVVSVNWRCRDDAILHHVSLIVLVRGTLSRWLHDARANARLLKGKQPP